MVQRLKDAGNVGWWEACWVLLRKYQFSKEDQASGKLGKNGRQIKMEEGNDQD